MPCNHRSGGDSGPSRREFLKAAVAIGGMNALAACIERRNSQPTSGNETVETKPFTKVSEGKDGGFVYRHQDKETSQHAWNKYLDKDDQGVPVSPRHHVLVLADYPPDNPTEEHRSSVETAFRDLERAYDWSNDGLLFTVGYSPAYFKRFETPLSDNIDLPDPEALSELDSPELDTYDVVLHLASDHPTAVLSAEEALFGEVQEINGVGVKNIDSLLEKRERRTGFIGKGLPAEHQDVDGIPDTNPVPEESPLYMGFESRNAVAESHPSYDKKEARVLFNQNSEYGVTIKEGRFAGGTTEHISKIRLGLHDWYNMELEDRMERMFTSGIDESDIGEVGQRMMEQGKFKGLEEESDVETAGMVGHATKVADVRRNDVSPLLRRDFDTTDDNHAGVHFVSLQEGISDFVETRKRMNATSLSENHEGIGDEQNNGILEFIDVERRGNYLIPPRRHRSLPSPNPG